MRRFLGIRWSGPIGLMACLCLFGCSPEPEDPIRIAINAWPGYEFLYLAQEKGFFQETGAEIRLVEFVSLVDVRAAFDRGLVDGMCCTLIELLLSRNQSDRDPRAVMLTDFSNGLDVVLGGGEIFSISDLKGKRVGAEVGSLNLYVLARALQSQSMNLSDVEIVQLPSTQMSEAFSEGRVDAVVAYPPVSLELVASRGAKTLFSSADIPGEVIDVVCLDHRVIEERIEDVVALIRAWDLSLEFARDHPEEALGIMAKREGMSPDALEGILSQVEVLDSTAQQGLLTAPGGITPTLELVDDTLRDIGQLEGASEIDRAVFRAAIERAAP